MDVNRFKDSIKADIKAELKPRKLLRTAFVPQTKGLMNPLKEVFTVFIAMIAQIFVQAKLISRNHPAVTKEVTGFGAIWLMIVDASSNVKFKRENIYQIIVFYGIVGMLVFGALDLIAFLMHFSLGHAHAQTNTSSLFNEAGTTPTTDNAPNWINTMFPYANQQTNASGIPLAIQGMLVTYNTALLALGTAFALYQVAHLFVESAHHGKFGGNRYSQLHAPLRLVIGIGLLVPTTYGFNSAQLIAIEMAKMGSGLASNVWVKFINGMNAYNGTTPSVQASDVNLMVQKLVVDEACTVAALSNHGSYASGYTPTWNSTNGGSSATPNGATETNTGNSYVITFDDSPGDGHCGQITIPQQKSNQYNLANNNYFEQAFTGQNGILSTIWKVANNIYQNSQGGTNTNGAKDPTLNPFASTCTSNCASPQSYTIWLGMPAATGASGTVTGILAQMQTAATNTATAYNTAQKNNANNATATSTDWTQAGSLLLKMVRDSGEQGSAQNPTIDVALPDADIMDSVTSSLSDTTDCSAFFSFLKFSCDLEGKRVILTTATAMKNISDAAKPTGLGVYSFNAGSNGSSNGGGSVLLKAVSGPMNTLMNGIRQVTGNGATPSTVQSYGQSIFNIMQLGSILMAVAAAFVAGGALVGSTPFTIDDGLVLVGIGVAIFPIAFSLGIMVPLMPAARFIFGLFTWIMTLFEAVIAMPVVALISINFEGEGMFAHGKQGWFILFQMMLRPVLMIFGLIGALLVFDTLAGFISSSIFNVWFGLHPVPTTPAQAVTTAATIFFNPLSGLTMIFQLIGFLYFYALTIYACANMCFGMINTIPDRILQWTGLPGGIGGNDGTDSVMQQASSAASGMITGVATANQGNIVAAKREERAEIAQNRQRLQLEDQQRQQKFNSNFAEAHQMDRDRTDAMNWQNEQRNLLAGPGGGGGNPGGGGGGGGPRSEFSNFAEASQMNKDMDKSKENDMNQAHGEAMQMDKDRTSSANDAMDTKHGEGLEMNKDYDRKQSNNIPKDSSDS